MTAILSKIPGIRPALYAAQDAWETAAGRDLDWQLNTILDANLGGNLAETTRVVDLSSTVLGASTKIDPSFPWGDASVDPNVYDLQGILTHEMGHVLGLGEAADDCGCAMSWFIPFASTTPRVVTEADVDALGDVEATGFFDGLSCQVAHGDVPAWRLPVMLLVIWIARRLTH